MINGLKGGNDQSVFEKSKLRKENQELKSINQSLVEKLKMFNKRLPKKERFEI